MSLLEEMTTTFTTLAIGDAPQETTKDSRIQNTTDCLASQRPETGSQPLTKSPVDSKTKQLHVLVDTDSFAVALKPPGLLIETSAPGRHSFVEFLKQELPPSKASDSLGTSFALLNTLGRAPQGLILIAKTTSALNELSLYQAAFVSRTLSSSTGVLRVL